MAGMNEAEAGSASSSCGREDLYICVLGLHSHLNGKEEEELERNKEAQKDWRGRGGN